MEGLNTREKAVLHLVARGKTGKEIADRLQLSEATVRFHVGNCLRKLGAKSRSEAVAVAISAGEIQFDRSLDDPKDR